MSMGDKMRRVPFAELIARMFEEYRNAGSIFGIPKLAFFRAHDKTLDIFGQRCGSPMGPAAGPHTQLAQNIVTAYLTGSRFIELKTVQKLDSLEIEKPCIDAMDEGFNTEWSTELSVPGAYDEYVKAWVLLHLLEELFGLGGGFVFNMSVGYDLEGIKTEKIDRFIEDLKDSSGNEVFKGYLSQLSEMLADGSFLTGTGLEGARARVKDIVDGISPRICSSVTLSTMHGCPPDEIEAICNYMLAEKGLDTYVKLNPTLLGFETVRGMLDRIGFDHVTLKRESFEHDLQYPDAVAMLKRLASVAAEQGRRFGVKLTNTLGSVNDRGVLPGDEMYMSGRSLFPLSINLAAKLSEEFRGKLPISYSGGITFHNVREVFETGIRPLTVATDMLKPGGYLRLAQMAAVLEDSGGWEMDSIDVEKLKALAGASLAADYSLKDFRGEDEVKVPGPLPQTDCYVAPCVVACPIHQDVPGYVRLVGMGHYSEALALIYEKNALPSMTGTICDHQCQQNCTRLDYEGCVLIRDVKKLAVLNGFQEFKRGWVPPEVKRDAKVAVIGAGPAGLSASYFLAREGFDVTVFEREASAGGVVEHVVPRFRISREDIERDVKHIEAHGVKFVFGADPGFSISELKDKEFKYVLIAIGTYSPGPFPIEGDNPSVMPSLEFLQAFNRDPTRIRLGKVVAVVGAGDTAMDTARAALKVKGVEKSLIVYRRAKRQMPASREEYDAAVEDGVEFHWLANPERFDADDTLTCRVMALGEKDASGRARPVPTDETITLHVDTLIPSIGDYVDAEALASAGLDVGDKGEFNASESGETETENVFVIGDARTGPSTIVRCIAEGRRAADAICLKQEPGWTRNERAPDLDGKARLAAVLGKRGKIRLPGNPSHDDATGFAENEGFRCLECNFVCNKCVEVCPNRANIPVPVEGFRDAFQVVHIDAYCNECGNCATFCPWDGRPYTDKPTVFSLKEDFENSSNPGWLVEGDEVLVRDGGEATTFQLNGGKLEGDCAMLRLFEALYRERRALFGPVDRPEE